MKALILAAGLGSRLNKYTQDKPKVMLPLIGKTLAQRHIDTLRQLGIDDVAFVGGHCIEALKALNCNVYENVNYATTNMIESLMVAKAWMDDDVIIIYGDIWLSKNALEKIISSQHKDVLAVDSHWQEYWKFRYDTVDFDLEQLDVDERGLVMALGRERVQAQDMPYRYVGAIKLSCSSLKSLQSYYNQKIANDDVWPASQKIGRQGYMTDILDELVQKKIIELNALDIGKNWLEFDTNDDYERVINAYREGKLANILDVELDE